MANQSIKDAFERMWQHTVAKIDIQINEKSSYITPQMFGAKGDGNTDDTVAIKAAIEEAKNTSKTLLIPSGTYKLTDIIDFDNIEVEGSDPEKCVLNMSGQTTAREHFIICKNKVSIKNIKFVQSIDGALLGMFGCNNSVMENCTFLVEEGVVPNGYFDLYQSNTDIRITNCLFLNYAKADIGGVWVRNVENTISENIIFDKCIFKHKTKDEVVGVWGWFGTVQNVNFHDCSFETLDGSYYPIHMFTLGSTGVTRNITLDNCKIYHNYAYGVTIKSTKEYDSEAVIENININNCLIEINPLEQTSGNKSFEASDMQSALRLNNCDININGAHAGFSYVIANNCTIKFEEYLADFSVFNNCTLHTTTSGKISNGSVEFNVCTIDFNNVTQDIILFQPQLDNSTVVIRNCTFKNLAGFSSSHFLFTTNSGVKLEIVDSKIDHVGIYATNPDFDLTLVGNIINGNNLYAVGSKFVPKIYNNLVNGALLQSGLTAGNDTVTPQMFGATGDNITDNHDQLQAMIDYAVAKRCNIFIPEGIYAFSGKLIFPANQYGTIITGQGKWKSAFKALTDDSQFYFTDFLRYEISQLQFLGTGTETVPLIEIVGVTHTSTIKECYIRSNMGMNISRCAYFNLENTNFMRVNNGHVCNYLLKVAGEYCWVTSCTFEGNLEQSIEGDFGVIINQGREFSFNDCDICNFRNGTGLLIQPSFENSDGVYNIVFRNTTFVRNKVFIRTICDRSISHISLDECSAFFEGSEEHFLYNSRSETGIGALSNLHGRLEMRGTIPTDKVLFAGNYYNGSDYLEVINQPGTPYDYSDEFPIKPALSQDLWNNGKVFNGLNSGSNIVRVKLLDYSPYKDYNLPSLTWKVTDGAVPTDVRLVNNYRGELYAEAIYNRINCYSKIILKLEGSFNKERMPKIDPLTDEGKFLRAIEGIPTWADTDFVTSQDMTNYVGPLSMQLNNLQTKVDNGLATKTTLWEGAAPDMGYLIASDSLWNYDFTVFHLSVSGYAFDVIANTSCYAGLDSKTILLPYYVNTSNVSGITYLTVAIGQSGCTVQSSHWNGSVYNLTGIDGIKLG